MDDESGRPAEVVSDVPGTVERRLAEVLAEFARTLLTDFPIQAILDHLVGRIVGVLPIDAAGVSLIAPGEDPRYIAASDDAALRFEQLQTELGEGPCVDAYETGEAVAVPDLRQEHAYETFASRALEAGLAAVFTFPLSHQGVPIGALDLYRTEAGFLDDEAMAAAQTLADVAAAYLINAQTRADLERSSERARQISLHDALTGLPNRTNLVQRLDHALQRRRRAGTEVAVIFSDLDQFKAVNDTYGHHAGDEVLLAVAARLSSVLRAGDTLARFSGDEFVVLCEDLEAPAQVEPIARRIDEAMATPFALAGVGGAGGVTVRLGASTGVAFAGPEADAAEQVLRDADAAMYQAKRGGGDRHVTFGPDDHGGASSPADMGRDLAAAVQRGGLRAAYQPIVATTDGRVTGVEALLRWSRSGHGPVSPELTVSIAEQVGLIAEVGRWILAQACRDTARWGDDGGAPVEVAVNVSTVQLMAAGFVAAVADVLDQTATDPSRLTLEITETVFIQDSDRALVVLQDLKDLGVKLALDDFGTGYSSLSYLKQFPIDVVKIDRVFVADLGRDEASDLIVDAVVSLAHGLGMTVVAEGVETAAQHEIVTGLGCDTCQGYYFARPLPASGIDDLVDLTNLTSVTLPALAGPHPS